MPPGPGRPSSSLHTGLCLSGDTGSRRPLRSGHSHWSCCPGLPPTPGFSSAGWGIPPVLPIRLSTSDLSSPHQELVSKRGQGGGLRAGQLIPRAAPVAGGMALGTRAENLGPRDRRACLETKVGSGMKSQQQNWERMLGGRWSRGGPRDMVQSASPQALLTSVLSPLVATEETGYCPMSQVMMPRFSTEKTSQRHRQHPTRPCSCRRHVGITVRTPLVVFSTMAWQSPWWAEGSRAHSELPQGQDALPG